MQWEQIIFNIIIPIISGIVIGVFTGFLTGKYFEKRNQILNDNQMIFNKMYSLIENNQKVFNLVFLIQNYTQETFNQFIINKYCQFGTETIIDTNIDQFNQELEKCTFYLPFFITKAFHDATDKYNSFSNLGVKFVYENFYPWNYHFFKTHKIHIIDFENKVRKIILHLLIDKITIEKATNQIYDLVPKFEKDNINKKKLTTKIERLQKKENLNFLQRTTYLIILEKYLSYMLRNFRSYFYELNFDGLLSNAQLYDKNIRKQWYQDYYGCIEKNLDSLLILTTLIDNQKKLTKVITTKVILLIQKHFPNFD